VDRAGLLSIVPLKRDWTTLSPKSSTGTVNVMSSAEKGAGLAVLDCESYESSIESICDIYRITSDLVIAFLSEIVLEEEYEAAPTSQGIDYFLKSIFDARFGEPVEPLKSVSWFHLTRVPSGTNFSEGILPLHLAKERVWETVIAIPFNQQIRLRLENMRKNGVDDFQYNLKINDRLHSGPYAMLVRESAFHAKTIGNWDYLDLPEIIADICNGYEKEYGESIRDEVSLSLAPCIVKFKSMIVKYSQIAPVLYYCWCKANHKEFGRDVNYNFDGRGATIPSEVIQRIEFV